LDIAKIIKRVNGLNNAQGSKHKIWYITNGFDKERCGKFASKKIYLKFSHFFELYDFNTL